MAKVVPIRFWALLGYLRLDIDYIYTCINLKIHLSAPYRDLVPYAPFIRIKSSSFTKNTFVSGT